MAALSMGFSPLEQMVQQPTDERSCLVPRILTHEKC
jgi:hypothetical protein